MVVLIGTTARLLKRLADQNLRQGLPKHAKACKSFDGKAFQINSQARPP
jgi:hypothetical protein